MRKFIFLIMLLLLISEMIFGQKKPVLHQTKPKPKVANPFKISGSLGTRSYFSAGSKSPMYQANPFGYSLFGSVNIQVTKHFSFPFSIAYSNRKTTFSQPFNQLGMSPSYKGVTFHAGYRSLRFSDYTLNGYNMLGGGFEVQKGLLRTGFMMGRFTSATATERGQPTTFMRWGYSARLGIGKKGNFFDIIYLNAEDSPSSIPNFQAYRLNPAKNTVFGLVINQKIKLNKAKNASLVFRADAGFSIYTGNIFAQNLDSSNFENAPPVLFKTVAPNISSRGVLAVNSSVNYTQKGMGLKIGYNRVDPGYASMGIYTTNNDLEVISFAPRFSLLKNKISVNGNLRIQRDNLLGDKRKSTRRILPNANININPSKNFGVSANVNYSTMNQTQGIKQTIPIPVAQLMNQANYSINLSPHFSFASGKQSINLNLGTNKVLDKGQDPERKKYSEFSGLNASANYGLNIEAIKGNVNVGSNYFSLTNFDANLNTAVTNDNIGFNAGMSKPFLKNKLSSNISLGYTISQTKDKANNINISTSYKPKKHHSINFGLSQAHSQYKNNENRNFTEFRGTLDYNYNF
jgi:hypothetical protein